MCYSAQIHADYKKLLRNYRAVMDLKAFAKLWVRENGLERKKIPKGIIDTIGPLLPTGATDELAARFAEDEQAWTEELFKQRKRLADNERKLAAKATKTAEIEVGRATRKIEQLKGWIADLHRRELKAPDWSIYPQWWAPVVVRGGDGYAIRPMRYQLRQPGQPPSSDYTKTGQMSGTYNARRDNLTRYWRRQFGHTHGLMIVDTFLENVEGPDGKNHRLRFRPKTGEPMLVACLWANWVDPEGKLPDMPCFAAVTDDPEPEVAAAGHDRTIVNIKPEHIEAWLNPDPNNLEALFAIFDDRRHPFYEHREAA
jgi:putative SOS response-associated peptidase YedK